MSFDPDEIKKLIQIIAGTHSVPKIKIFDATVVSVNEEERTCIVDSDVSQIEGLEVRIMLEVCDGDYKIPAIGSTVTVAMSDNNDPYIVKVTELTKIVYIVGDQGFEIIDGQQKFNDGSFGGLIKIQDLVSKINTLEDDLNKIKQAFTSWSPVSQDGGAALKLAAASWSGQTITKTNREDIENTKITHGESL